MPETNTLRNRRRVCFTCKIAKGTGEHYTFDQWHCNGCAEQSKEEEASSLWDNYIKATEIDKSKNESEAVPSDQGISPGDVVKIINPVRVQTCFDVPCPTRKIIKVPGPLDEATIQTNRKATELVESPLAEFAKADARAKEQRKALEEAEEKYMAQLSVAESVHGAADISIVHVPMPEPILVPYPVEVILREVAPDSDTGTGDGFGSEGGGELAESNNSFCSATIVSAWRNPFQTQRSSELPLSQEWPQKPPQEWDDDHMDQFRSFLEWPQKPLQEWDNEHVDQFRSFSTDTTAVGCVTMIALA